MIPLKTSANGLAKIIGYEGKLRSLGDGRYIAYRCPANVPTIFVGCTEGVHDGMIVTEAEGEAMFAREIAKFEAGVASLVKVELNQNQFDALVSFSYNCGLGALKKSRLLKRVNAGDFEGAAHEFANWRMGGGRVLRGLVSRRASEASLFLKPVEAPTEPAMPQSVQKAPEPVSKPVVATGAAATAIAVTQAAPAVLPALPVPAVPEAVTTSLTNLDAWKTIGEHAWTLKNFALSQPSLSAAVGITLAAVWLWPKPKASP